MRAIILAVSGFIMIIVSAIVGLAFTFISESKNDTATYRIESGNDKIYYANTFRMYGKGITFDSVDGKKIILMGDIDIEYIKKEQ
jgi:hypothetical protein